MSDEELRRVAAFLCARLREWEGVCNDEDCCREYGGHIAPSIARLEMILATLEAQEKRP
jgi:hypothetical protein